jgi:tetratricopeptide (TPR) repeat protein
LNFDQAFEMARLAGARFIIWGSFQKSGDTYRFNMVLGDAPNETVRKLRSTKSDLFGIQDDLAAQAKKLIQQAGVAMAADDAPKTVAAAAPVAVSLSNADAGEAPKVASQPPAAAPVTKAAAPKPVMPDPKRQAREIFNNGARMGDYSDKERDCYLKAAQLDPSFAEPYYALGELYFQRQQNREALTNFEKYLVMKPNAAEAADVRTVVAELKKQFGEPAAPPPPAAPGPVSAEAPAAAPDGLVPTAEQAGWSAAKWYNEGLKLEQNDKGRYVDYLRQAIKSDPNFAPAYYNLGYDCYERNQYREAREYFEKYLQLAPKAADAQQIRDLLEVLKKY